MLHALTRGAGCGSLALSLLIAVGCAYDDSLELPSPGGGGDTGFGGALTDTGGAASGGFTSTGGLASTGGITNTGGIRSTGGITSTGGFTSTGGTSSGGTVGNGGTTGSGGRNVNGPCKDLNLFCFDPFDMFIFNPDCFTCNSGKGCQACVAFKAE
jgi:hypothetical protein